MGVKASSEIERAIVTYGDDVLPGDPIRDRGPVSAAFLGLRIDDFRRAAQYVRDLPYGRNAAASDMLAVLNERKGTCSTKHALLKALAGEQGLPIRLMLGIYEMDARNTPGIGHVLEEHHLPCIPEAHCYLVHQERRIDVTRNLDEREFEPIAAFLIEEEITTEQISEYKEGKTRNGI
jgi:Transglutaminase-like superfamily